MSETDHEYEWTVTFRHETQGFGRSPVVRATNHARAIERSRDALRLDGYEPDHFAITDLRRGAILRHHVASA